MYLAKSRGVEGFERQVALKLLHQHLREEPAFLGDLIEEAKLVARIRHPNVVPVLDVGQDPNGTFLVMEYVEGTSLSGLFRASAAARSRLDPGVGIRILIDALSGLHSAHEQTDSRGDLLGVVHRDFSPQNVLVGTDGIARLTDFGIAKAASRISHTRTGTTKGKLAYMSPEQSRGVPLDRRTDIWSAGVMAWELVARRRLFKGDEAAIVLAVLDKPIPSLVELVPDFPPEMARAIESALVRDPSRRIGTAKAFRDALVRSASGNWSLADTEQVASTVAHLMEDVLASRRARVARVIQLRQEMSRIVGVVPSALSPTPSTGGAAPVAAERDPRTTESGHAVMSQRLRRPRSIAISVSTLVVGLVVGVLLGRRAVAPGPAPERAALPSAAASVTIIEPLASPSPTPPPVTAAAPIASATLVVESNVPIVRVDLDGVEQPIESGRTRLELSVAPGPHELEVTSKDGRRQRLRAAEKRASVRFASARAAPLVKNPY